MANRATEIRTEPLHAAVSAQVSALSHEPLQFIFAVQNFPKKTRHK
jgi:hypothetical protein